MAIIAENKGGEITLAPQGNHIARCYSMVHLGTIETEYMGEVKMVNKVRLTFELPNEKHIFKEEKGAEPFVVTKEYTLSMAEKATLKKDLESWRGKAFTEQEAEEFDVTKLLGVPAMVNVIHKVSKKGNSYVLVSGITPLPKGFDAPDQINSTFEFNYDDKFENLETLPEWLREKIQSSNEYKKKMGIPFDKRVNSAVDKHEAKKLVEAEDDLPF